MSCVFERSDLLPFLQAKNLHIVIRVGLIQLFSSVKKKHKMAQRLGSFLAVTNQLWENIQFYVVQVFAVAMPNWSISNIQWGFVFRTTKYRPDQANGPERLIWCFGEHNTHKITTSSGRADLFRTDTHSSCRILVTGQIGVLF